MTVDSRTETQRHGAGAGATTVLDPQAIERLRELDPGGQSKLLVRVAEAFGTTAARLVPQMASALEAQDTAAIRHVAHTLKSSSASIGAIRLSRLCARIEAMCRDGHVEGLAEAVAEFRSEVAAAQQSLNRILDIPA